MKISIRSKVLIYIGTLVYGDPQAWGLQCSKEEFYAMPNERPGISPNYLHPRVAIEWKVQIRNVLVDRVRQRVFKHMAIAACVASLAIFSVGSLGIYGVNKTKSSASSVKAKIASSKDRDDRIIVLKDQAEKLSAQAKSGAITKEEYDRRVKEIDDEYKELTK